MQLKQALVRSERFEDSRRILCGALAAGSLLLAIGCGGGGKLQVPSSYRLIVVAPTDTLSARINDSGVVVGTTVPPRSAFTWQDGILRKPTFGSAAGPSTGSDINGRGEITGTLITLAGVEHPFVANTVAHDQFGPSDAVSADAFALNNLGDICGKATFPSSSSTLQERAFARIQGSYVIIPWLDASTPQHIGFAMDINDSRTVVGWMTKSDGTTSGFNFHDGVLREVSIAASRDTRLLAINNQGAMAGYFEWSPGHSHALILENGVPRDLGALPGGTESIAYDLNDLGQMVGMSEAAVGANFVARPFLYSDGVMYDLMSRITNPGQWAVQSAVGINNHGQIVCLAANTTNMSAQYLVVLQPE